MDFYKNYIDNISQSPNEEYRGLTQAFIDEQWFDTTLLKTVEEEKEIGSFEFQDIDVWKNTISEFLINVVKNAKDFRRLMFQNIDHDSTRGRYYKFDNNYWIVYEETNEEEPYPDVSVRRCNNIAKWIDEDGNLFEYPCILDYELSSTNAQVTKDVTQANSSVTLILQGNKNTHKIKKNKRFIFNGVPYKFYAINNYMQDSYVDKNVPLLFLNMYLDIEQVGDDLVNNIANFYDKAYTIQIDQDDFVQVKDFSGKLSATVKCNGEIVKDNYIKWNSSNNEVIEIDDQGNYHIVGENGSTSIIRCSINEKIYDEITIEVVSEVLGEKVLIVKPSGNISLYLDDSIDIFANVYQENIKQSDIVKCEVEQNSNVPIENYTLFEDVDKWVLTNNKSSNNLLRLKFTSGNLSQEIEVKLKGNW